LKIDNVYNIDGYIYRIAHNVYARFINEEVRGRHISIDSIGLPYGNDFTGDLEKDETCIRLRSEIAYLGKIRREIVVMHYFQGLKLHEIARRLNIPPGTVKWHLHDARNQIKEGIEMNEKGTLAMLPVKFSNITFGGEPGAKGEEPKDYFAKLISQNVAYAAYHEAKTITEIAQELGIPAVYIEDEVAHLEDNGFIDQVPGGKYLTNIFIHETPNDVQEQLKDIYIKSVKIVCEKYVPLIFDAMADYKQKGIYSPQDDFNFLMWPAITWACGHKLCVCDEWSKLPKYYAKHKDGGNYITNAFINRDFGKNENKGYEKFEYDCSCKDKYPVDAWQLSSCFDDRSGRLEDYFSKDIRWKDSLIMDYEYLYEYMTGKITKDPVHADKFKRLYDKGYLVTKGNSEYVNIIVMTLSQNEFTDMLPAIPDELKAVCEEVDKEVFMIKKAHYPPHMQDLCRIRFTNCLALNDNRMRVLEQLIAAGTLKPLTASQKLSVNTIMFCDVLPNENKTP
jgi:predicted DNA-binding transcriptional regulator